MFAIEWFEFENALRDLTYFLKVQILNLYMSETVELAQNMHRTTFIHLDIYQEMIPLRYSHLMTLTYFLRTNILNCNISEKVRTRENTWSDFK